MASLTDVPLTDVLQGGPSREVLQRRLDKLDRIEEEISSVHFQVRQLYIRIEDGDKVLKEIVQGEDKIRDMKNQIVKVMVEEAKETQSSITFLERYVNDIVLLRLKIPQILHLPD